MGLLWIGIAAAGWLYLSSVRDLKEIGFIDAFWPGRWHEVRRVFGNHEIDAAEAALRANDPDTALHLYRTGLAKAPANTAGRIGLAKLYVAFRRPELARDLLRGGLPALAENPEYLQLALGFLLEFQFDSELRACAEPLLIHPSPKVRRQAALHIAAVAFHRGDFDGAESLLAAHQLNDTPEGALLLARADFERGFPDLALTRLQPALNGGPSQTAALALAAQIHERRGRTADLARNTALRFADDPLAPAPRLALLRQLHDQHRAADLARETDAFLNLFAHDEHALLALADFAANTGQPELARRVQQSFAQHRWNPDAPALLYAEACIAAGRYADGMVELDRYLQSSPQAGTRYGPAFDGLRTVALFGLNRDDDARLQLEHLLAQPNLRAENLSAVATRLLAFGRGDSARLALTRAVTLDPRNQPALATLVRLEAEQGKLDALPAHLRQFLALRRPSRDALAFVYQRLGSDLNLLEPEQLSLLAELRQRIGRDLDVAPAS
jgi:hypothetical protein